MRLASSKPHILWLLIVGEPAFEQIAFAAWSVERRPPRVATLLVERSRVVYSDGETLCALASANRIVDAVTHERWLEILAANW